LDKYAAHLKKVADIDFKRVIFLGSGPLLGTALESHLKLLELTDGKVVCKHDSYLGFRHGPKAIVDDTTLLVYLLSNNPYVQQYEADLIAAVNAGKWGMYSIGISEILSENVVVNLPIVLSTESRIEEEFLAVCSVLPAQILGFYKSIQLGLSPDNPSVNGKISRVVKGVKIYPYQLRNESHP
jgi:tagatose-6-phosphate ketose/aldose isomerase